MAVTETVTETARQKDLRAFRFVLAILAVASVIAGAVVGFVPDLLSLPPGQALSVSSVLLLMGIVDATVLLQWRRLFR